MDGVLSTIIRIRIKLSESKQINFLEILTLVSLCRKGARLWFIAQCMFHRKGSVTCVCNVLTNDAGGSRQTDLCHNLMRNVGLL